MKSQQLHQLIESGAPLLVRDIVSKHEQPVVSWILVNRDQGGLSFWLDNVEPGGPKDGTLLYSLLLRARSENAEIAIMALRLKALSTYSTCRTASA